MVMSSLRRVPSRVGATTAAPTAAPPAPAAPATPVAPPQPTITAQNNNNFKPPLHTDGKWIIDADGKVVKLASVAIIDFGKAGTHWGQGGGHSLANLLDSIRNAGFNSIRLPISVQLMVEAGVTANQGNMAAAGDNYLLNKTNVQLLDEFLNQSAARGLGVIIDMHDHNKDAWTSPLWYQNSNPSEGGSGIVFNGLNANGNQYTGKVTEDDYVKVWQALAERYKNHPAVIGADLFNEPHEPATWGDGGPTDWRRGAEKIGGAVQQIAPNWLIVVEGIGADKKTNNIGDAWWGGNLANVAKEPVRLNNVVYSPHDYGPSVWGNWWLSDPTAMRELWDREWGYIARNNIAPIWVGEFGQPNFSTGDGGGRQVRQLLDYLEEIGGNFSYWAWHDGSSGDTGGYAKLNNPIPEKADVLRKFMNVNNGWGDGQPKNIAGWQPDYRPFDTSRPGFPPPPFETYTSTTPGIIGSVVQLGNTINTAVKGAAGAIGGAVSGAAGDLSQWLNKVAGYNPNDPDQVHQQKWREEALKLQAASPALVAAAPVLSRIKPPDATTAVTQLGNTINTAVKGGVAAIGNVLAPKAPAQQYTPPSADYKRWGNSGENWEAEHALNWLPQIKYVVNEAVLQGIVQPNERNLAENLMLGVVGVESAGDPGVTQHHGWESSFTGLGDASSQGLTQLIFHHQYEDENPYDPVQNLRMGLRTLWSYYRTYGNRWDTALMEHLTGNVTDPGKMDDLGKLNAGGYAGRVLNINKTARNILASRGQSYQPTQYSDNDPQAEAFDWVPPWTSRAYQGLSGDLTGEDPNYYPKAKGAGVNVQLGHQWKDNLGGPQGDFGGDRAVMLEPLGGPQWNPGDAGQPANLQHRPKVPSRGGHVAATLTPQAILTPSKAAKAAPIAPTVAETPHVAQIGETMPQAIPQVATAMGLRRMPSKLAQPTPQLPPPAAPASPAPLSKIRFATPYREEPPIPDPLGLGRGAPWGGEFMYDGAFRSFDARTQQWGWSNGWAGFHPDTPEELAQYKAQYPSSNPAMNPDNFLQPFNPTGDMSKMEDRQAAQAAIRNGVDTSQQTMNPDVAFENLREQGLNDAQAASAIETVSGQQYPAPPSPVANLFQPPTTPTDEELMKQFQANPILQQFLKLYAPQAPRTGFQPPITGSSRFGY